MLKMTDVTAEYINLKEIDPQPAWQSVKRLVLVAGDKTVDQYNRLDARSFVNSYDGSVRTTTIRRRLNSICAILNYAYYEYDIEKRNPFARITIKGEGKDSVARQPFSVAELKQLYSASLSFGGIRLILPILGETGCRLSEVLGLSKYDIHREGDYYVLHIHENLCRGLKTTGSDRQIPLVSSYAVEALEKLLADTHTDYLFPTYAYDGLIRNLTASATLAKYLKNNFDGKTAHCLRHSMRDRLREAEVPLEAIDQIGGWSAVSNMGSSYGNGYSTDKLVEYLSKVALCD